MFILLCLSFCVAAAAATTPTYCQCTRAFVYDPTGECFTSGNYGLSNACYRCPIINSSGVFNYCGSLPYLNYSFCGATGAVAVYTAQCNAIGGNTGATTFGCSTSNGANMSQITCSGVAPVTGTPTIAAPVMPTSVVPTSGDERAVLSVITTVSIALLFALL